MDVSKLRETARPAAPRPKAPAGSTVSGIVTVAQDNYRPEHVEVREAIGKRMFTANFRADDIVKIEKDPQVVRVDVSEIIPLQKPPASLQPPGPSARGRGAPASMDD